MRFRRAGSLAAGAATGLSCGEGVVAGRVAGSASQGFSCGQIRSNIFRVTPLVQPKPSCSGYSRRRRRCRSNSRHTSPPAFAYCHRYAARWSGSAGDLHGDLLLTIVLQPSTATHCSGAQPLGASHCWPLLTVVVVSPPGLSRRDSAAAATFVARSRDAALTYSRNSAAAVS